MVENFEAADTNGDGKVSASEAMAYERENTSASTSTSSSDSTTASTSSSDSTTTDAALAQRLMDLMRAYSDDEGSRRGSVAVSA